MIRNSITIGVDGNEANVPNRVGVSVYTYEMLKYFESVSKATHQFVVYLRKPAMPELPKETAFFRYQVVKPDFIWSQISLPVHLFMNRKPDAFFSPAHYAPRVSPIPTIVTIHDLAYKFFPNEFLSSDLYKLNKWTEYSVKKATKVICVSNHTQTDLLKLYPEATSKTTVVLNGYRKRSRRSIKSVKSPTSPAAGGIRGAGIKSNSNIPYILFVGTIQPRKNITTLIEAFESFVESHPNYELKIAGKKGWLYTETLKRIESSPASKQIKYLGFVDNEQLETLYSNAYITVLPSLYEGFGLPVLEAMSYGSPVITSDSSSLPEVGGDAVLYCNPDDSKTITVALEKLQDSKLRKSLQLKAEKQLKKFSWEKCAEETLNVIKSAVV